MPWPLALPRACFKNTYGLLNPRALKISTLYENPTFLCMDKICHYGNEPSQHCFKWWLCTPALHQKGNKLLPILMMTQFNDTHIHQLASLSQSHNHFPVFFTSFPQVIHSHPKTPHYTTTHMLMSSNGNIFHFTGHLCVEFTGHRWIPRTKASDTEPRCFLWSSPEYMAE